MDLSRLLYVSTVFCPVSCDAHTSARDNPFRQLQHQKFVTGGMTVEACTSACKTAGFALTGLEFGGECCTSQ
jgi:hypothetical protein